MLSEGSDPANPPKQTFELNLFLKNAVLPNSRSEANVSRDSRILSALNKVLWLDLYLCIVETHTYESRG